MTPNRIKAYQMTGTQITRKSFEKNLNELKKKYLKKLKQTDIEFLKNETEVLQLFNDFVDSVREII